METLKIMQAHTHLKWTIQALESIPQAMAKLYNEPTSSNGELTQAHKLHTQD